MENAKIYLNFLQKFSARVKGIAAVYLFISKYVQKILHINSFGHDIGVLYTYFVG